MKVENKIMYHIHTSNEYDDMWRENNEFMVDDNFISKCGRAIPDFNTICYNTDGEKGSLAYAIKYYLEEEIEHQDPEVMRDLLEYVYMIISNANRTKCEMALEICRSNYFSSLPSRLHSIWGTDKDGIEFWRHKLLGSDVYELSLTGELFKSSAILLPNDNLTLEESIKQAEYYWNPVFIPEAEKKKEYLFQGKVLVKKKLL